MLSLFNPNRFSAGVTSPKREPDDRTEYERDYDRILFSAPVRRLADKTQVFPLEKNDSVRTRLTHSHEVSNLCRSLATQLLRKNAGAFGPNIAQDQVPVIAASVGLAHDLGNPPFGHQGEASIQRWFKTRPDLFLADGGELSEQQKQDFRSWEGNAQALRLLTRLQVAKGSFGLDLTFASLAALMKYTVPSIGRSEKKECHPALKKFGYFSADQANAEKILASVGLVSGKRHALAYLMEACDDIAYSVIDIEDAIKKGLVSINDLLVAIESAGPMFADIAKGVGGKVNELRTEQRPTADVNEIGSQYYRTFTIHHMMNSVADAFLRERDRILSGDFPHGLLDAATCSPLCKALKSFAREHAYNAPSVKKLELEGDTLLQGLMSYFWRAIEECSLDRKKRREVRLAVKAPEPTPFGQFVYSHISRNYVASFEAELGTDPTPINARYHQLLLLTDMVSGMTENFAIDLFAMFREVHDGA
ncbi:dGTP triphosphohydrolase [Mesorhizobium sp. KR9-304]|uniref:dGTP triphosphohydrolase n=1 Tax=Mesorhizobium sp. KR9-304 TaxID=3156614 RepID=UPI0032B59561